MHLPEELTGIEDGGKGTMTKEELELFVDRRRKTNFEHLEKEVQQLKTRLSSLESKDENGNYCPFGRESEIRQQGLKVR